MQEPVDALEADGAVPGGDHRHLRGRDHLRCCIMGACLAEESLQTAGNMMIASIVVSFVGARRWVIECRGKPHTGEPSIGFRVCRAGTLSCAPNASNPRDLDLSMTYTFKGKNATCQGSQKYRMR